MTRHMIQGIFGVVVHSAKASERPGIVILDVSTGSDSNEGWVRAFVQIDASEPSHVIAEDIIRDRYGFMPGSMMVERGRLADYGLADAFRVTVLVPQEESADIHDIHHHHSVTVGHDGINTCECGARWLNMIGRGALDLALQGR